MEGGKLLQVPITAPNFTKIGQSRDITIFRYFKMSIVAILYFEILKFYWLTDSGGPTCITMPNIVKIRQSIAEL